jgi:hypothetical protein
MVAEHGPAIHDREFPQSRDGTNNHAGIDEDSSVHRKRAWQHRRPIEKGIEPGSAETNDLLKSRSAMTWRKQWNCDAVPEKLASGKRHLDDFVNS